MISLSLEPNCLHLCLLTNGDEMLQFSSFRATISQDARFVAVGKDIVKNQPFARAIVSCKHTTLFEPKVKSYLEVGEH